MKAVAAMLVLIMVSTAAGAADIPRELLTTNGAILCASPFNLDEAYQAAKANDRKWLNGINCLIVPEGLKITRIYPGSFPDTLRPWQVRLTLDDGTGATLWGLAVEFRRIDGERIKF